MRSAPSEYSGNELCDYGCGQKANYILSNGKLCCSVSYNKCPEIRRKNSEGLKRRYKEQPQSWNRSKANLSALKKGSEANQRKARENAKFEFRKSNTLTSEYLRKMLVEAFEVEQKCSNCGLTEWQGHQIPLEVHHKDGDTSNNELSNLEFLCPNCHALTANYRGRNIPNQGSLKVSDEELLEALSSESSIRKALQKVGLAPKGGNYKRVYYLLSKQILEQKE